MAAKLPKSRGKSDGKILMDRLAHHQSSGTMKELFEDDYFVTDILKILYEDALDSQDKMEILSALEQEGCQWLNENSVDMVISTLMDMYSDVCSNPASIAFTQQLLITITTIFIEHEEHLESELCVKFISLLIDLLKKVNNVANRRPRATACHCLGQIEAWKSGALWKWKDTLNKLAREERTDVSQDYVHLLVTIMNSSLEDNSGDAASQDKDFLPVVSYAMENSTHMTSSGISAILYPVIKLVQNSERISPTVFKPLMLQYLPCSDINIMCLIINIQNHFRGEILSIAEEKVLLGRITEYISHASFSANSRLLAIQWITFFIDQHKSEDILRFLTPSTAPSVFQPLDLHTSLLVLQSKCKGSEGSQNISKDLYYLTQLAETTGGIRVTCALYYFLYLQICDRSSESVYAPSLRITKTLFQNFPHLIPLIVDFLQAVKTSRPETMFHGEILNLLHKTVLSLPLNSLLANYQNYLQVWMLTAQDPSIYQQKQLRRLLELVKEASTNAADDWILGTLILSICRTMMLHNHTDIFYPQMGDLLFFMMHHYGDLDTRDNARFYYALLLLSSDTKTKDILSSSLSDGLQLGENIADMFPGSVANALPSDIKVLDLSPVHLERSQISVIFEESHKDNTQEGDSNDSTEIIPVYRKQLSAIKTHLECHIAASIVEDSEYADLVAVSLEICDDKKKALCDDPSISVMLKGVTTDVMFELRPDTPVPISLYPSVTFGHNRTTFQCSVDPLHLELGDFLVPFPWHLFSFPQKRPLFQALWQDCTVGSSGTSQGVGVESVKILKCKKKDLFKSWKEAFVNEDSNASSQKINNKGTDRYLFFMPPSYHLLFQSDARANDTVLKIASDFPPLFGHLDDYLDAL